MKSEITHTHGGMRWVLLSDHGFVSVHDVVPVPLWLKEWVARETIVYYFVDSTILRIWLRDPSDPDGVERRIGNLERAEPVGEQTLSSLGIALGSPQAGHITYLCRPGMVFWPDFFSVQMPLGMHGYAPTEDLACPVETSGMPAVPDSADHAAVGRVLKRVLGATW